MTAVLARDVTDLDPVRVSAAPTVFDSKGRPTALMRLEPAADGVPLVLSCGEATVALFYSGTRLTWQHTADEVAALAVRGVTRLGLGQVRRIDAAHRADGLAWMRREITGREYDRRERRRWARSEGGEDQRGLACILARNLYDVANGRPFLPHVRRAR